MWRSVVVWSVIKYDCVTEDLLVWERPRCAHTVENGGEWYHEESVLIEQWVMNGWSSIVVCKHESLNCVSKEDVEECDDEEEGLSRSKETDEENKVKNVAMLSGNVYFWPGVLCIKLLNRCCTCFVRLSRAAKPLIMAQGDPVKKKEQAVFYERPDGFQKHWRCDHCSNVSEPERIEWVRIDTCIALCVCSIVIVSHECNALGWRSEQVHQAIVAEERKGYAEHYGCVLDRMWCVPYCFDDSCVDPAQPDVIQDNTDWCRVVVRSCPCRQLVPYIR